MATMRLWASWDPPSWALIERLQRRTLTAAWLPRIRSGIEALARTAIIPAAKNALAARYHHTGAAGRSLRHISTAMKRESVEVELGSTLFANDPPTFGEWAASPFAYPLGLHEGIKRHWVYIRYGNWERKGLVAWARAHGLREPPPGKNWRIRVYKQGRTKSALPFLRTAVMERRDDIERMVFRSLDQAILRSAIGGMTTPMGMSLGAG